MAAPQVLASATWTASASGTSITLSMPSGIQAGDRLIAIVGASNSLQANNITLPSGWTSNDAWFYRAKGSDDALVGSLRVIHKIAAGNETNQTITHLYSGKYCSIVLRCSASNSIALSDPFVGSTGSVGAFPSATALHPDAPVVAVTAGDHLALPVFMFLKSDPTWTPPSGYTAVTEAKYAAQTLFGNPMVGVSKATLSGAQTINPGVATVSNTTTNVLRMWCAGTVVLSNSVSGRRNKIMGGF
jgi:hypothetical protein